STNPSILAFLREHGDDRMLCVHNLSKSPQPSELDLTGYSGVHPIESVGGENFPEIGGIPYLLTLPGHGFNCIHLQTTTGTNPDSGAVEEIPTYGLPSAGVGARSTVKTAPVPTPRTQDTTRSAVTAAVSENYSGLGESGKGNRPI